jgi:hypothetical protein
VWRDSVLTSVGLVIRTGSGAETRSGVRTGSWGWSGTGSRFVAGFRIRTPSLKLRTANAWWCPYSWLLQFFKKKSGTVRHIAFGSQIKLTHEVHTTIIFESDTYWYFSAGFSKIVKSSPHHFTFRCPLFEALYRYIFKCDFRSVKLMRSALFGPKLYTNGFSWHTTGISWHLTWKGFISDSFW